MVGGPAQGERVAGEVVLGGEGADPGSKADEVGAVVEGGEGGADFGLEVWVA